jgi:predicted nucleic acid-binding protein
MKILIDIPIWSKFVRKRNYDKNREIIEKLSEIILNKQEVIIGPVRQELLSGMSNNEIFFKLKQKMETFKNEPIEDSDYELAADFSNICRQHGIQ